MQEITLANAVDLIRAGKATFDGTTHTDRFGFAAIITRHDLSTTDHVADVGQDDIAKLTEANAASAV